MRDAARGRFAGWRTADTLLALPPAALLVAFSFQGGGFFPWVTAAGAVALALLLLLRVTLAEQPVAGLSVPYVAGAGLLALFALWTLLSGTWSDAPGRAVAEYDRVLLYLLAFLAAGAPGHTVARLRWIVRVLAAAILAVCVCALVARVAPDVWAASLGTPYARLNWPLTYWNALGLLAAIGWLISFCLTSDAREAPGVRVAAAAALPVLAAVLLLTFSRGAIAAGAAGLVIALLVVRPSALPSGLLVAVPATGIAVAAAYGAELVASDEYSTPAGIAEGHDLGLVVAACAAGAAAARLALLALDRRTSRWSLPERLRRPRIAVAAGLAVVAVATAAAVAAGAPAAVARQYDRFVKTDTLRKQEHTRSRLTDVANNGRIDNWTVALRAFEAQRLRGHGAGTYALEWERRRPVDMQIEDGHSLYFEVLAELGIVGLALVGGVILLMLGGLLARTRGAERGAAGALLAAAVAWTVHAGVDWDWEMPAVTLWLFAAGGAALAAAPGRSERTLGRTGRVVAGLGLLLIAILPARMVLGDLALRESQIAFARGDCPRAIDRALDSTEAVSWRAEPFMIIGVCDVRLGEPALAVRALENAVARDPRNWDYHYTLALVRAVAGIDPRGAAREARRLNPLSELAADAVRRFRSGDADELRRRAARARLPLE